MRGRLRTGLRTGLVAGVILGSLLGVDVGAQGPYSAQIQRALNAFVGAAHTWTGTQTFSGQVLFADGSVSTPGAAFTSHPSTGAYLSAANVLAIASNGGFQMDLGGGAIAVRSDSLIGWYSGTTANGTLDTYLTRDAAATLALRNGTNPQTFNIYNTFTDASNYERLALGFSSNVAVIGPVAAGTGSNRSLRFQINGAVPTILFNIAGTDVWSITNAGHWSDLGAHTITAGGTITGTLLASTTNVVTPSASQAAGGTVNLTGSVSRQQYQVTVAPAAGDCSTAFFAAALTADCTIATLKAGQKLVAVYADVTAGFTCSGTCTGTKVMQAGTAAGGTQILAAALNVAATGQFGLADADLGSGMTRAAAIQGGLIGSWSTTTPVSVRFTSGTGNWGSGAATFVNAGTVKFTLVTEQVK